MPSLAEFLLIMSHTCPTGVHGHDCAVASLLTSQGSVAVFFVDILLILATCHIITRHSFGVTGFWCRSWMGHHP